MILSTMQNKPHLNTSCLSKIGYFLSFPGRKKPICENERLRLYNSNSKSKIKNYAGYSYAK